MVQPPWRVVKVPVDRALVKWDNPAMEPLAASQGSHHNPWQPVRLLRLVDKCPVAQVHPVVVWGGWLVAPWVVEWVAAWVRPVDPWAAWA